MKPRKIKISIWIWLGWKLELLLSLVLLAGSSLLYLALYFFMGRFEEEVGKALGKKAEYGHLLDGFAPYLFLVGLISIGWPAYTMVRRKVCRRLDF